MHECTVVKVVDGDTMEVVMSLGFGVRLQVRIRLIGIDTCEIFRPVDADQKRRGLDAKQFVEDTVLNKTCRIDIPGERKCKYGRYLAILYPLDSPKSLNDMLCEKGFGKNMQPLNPK